MSLFHGIKAKMEEMSSFQLGVISALFLSVASSVSIVICNKALMSNLGFPFATTLTSWHLMFTFCTLHEAKPVDMKTVMFFWHSKWCLHWISQLEPWHQFHWILPDDKTCNHSIHGNARNHFPQEAVQPENDVLSLFLLLVGVDISSVTYLQLKFCWNYSVLSIITRVGQIVSFSTNFSSLITFSCYYYDGLHSQHNTEEA